MFRSYTTFAMSIIRISKYKLDFCDKTKFLVNNNINNIRSTKLSLNLILTTQTEDFKSSIQKNTDWYMRLRRTRFV